MIAAILCQLLCTNDVMDKVWMCVKSVKMAQKYQNASRANPFLPSIDGKEQTNMATPVELRLEANNFNKCFLCIPVDRLTK